VERCAIASTTVVAIAVTDVHSDDTNRNRQQQK
jgi:hypothetical protein